MATVFETFKDTLNHTTADDVEVKSLPDGSFHIRFLQHNAMTDATLPEDTPEAVSTWKKALEGIEGLWEDRDGIVEEMNAIRKEADRSFSH